MLKNYGYHILETDNGEQACGDIGEGRMLEPQQIFNCFQKILKKVEAKKFLTHQQILKNLRFVITTGPTIERIDPVRYISNFSSGKMGYALAQAANVLGAHVTLISGPTQLPIPTGCKLINVVSAREMLDASLLYAKNTDVFISAAAIADYAPSFSEQKIKKAQDQISMKLTKTQDIITAVNTAYPNLFSVGFCAETENIISHAKEKLVRKQCDIIVANYISQNGYPFGEDTNELYVVTNSGVTHLVNDSKTNLAYQLLNLIEKAIKVLS